MTNNKLGRATSADLDDLHGLIARELAKKIRSGDFTAAELNVARQLLKDNHIEAMPVAGTPLMDLASILPFAGSDAASFYQ